MRARLLVENHRGVVVPRTLGLWLALAAVVSTALVAWTQPDGPVARPGWGALAATLLVFGAGLVDDLGEGGPRGIRDHLLAFTHGQVSSGILKLVVIPGAAIVAIALQAGGSGLVRLAGVVLIAGCANVWNGLDVRPGRALKFAILAMIALVGVPLRLLPTLPLVALGSAGALWPDLRERAMLGDGGANLLGFTIGLGLYLVLPAWGVVTAAMIAVGLNVVAETATLSRVIDALPPVRWFDGLGRLPSSEV
jgi:UDP-GlcNAc:undecaprenyl-phosphate/decaprenyl-phosphate GlcNAc-1-phosphate transferase